jgi:hypothetical protein
LISSGLFSNRQRREKHGVTDIDKVLYKGRAKEETANNRTRYQESKSWYKTWYFPSNIYLSQPINHELYYYAHREWGDNIPICTHDIDVVRID